MAIPSLRQPCRRSRGALIAGLLLGAFLSARAQDDDGDVDGDADLEADDFESTQEIDFDISMPEEDRAVRMKTCFDLSMARLAQRQTEVQQAVAQAVQQDAKMTPAQVFQSIMFSSMMSCYINISPGFSMPSASQLSEEDEAMVFNPAGAQKASKRHWELLEKIILEENAKAKPPPAPQKPQAKEAPGVPAPDAAAAPARGSQWMYVLVVFGMLFGLAFLGVARLMKSENDEKKLKQKRKEEKDAKKSKKKA